MVISINLVHMSKKCNLLTFYERQQIEYYLRLKFSKREISRKLKRDHTVIVREIKRNSSKEHGYRAEIAQERANTRAKKTNKRKLETDYSLSWYIDKELSRGLSPEQIAGRLKEKPPNYLKGEKICHETIYQYIYQSKYGKCCYRYLRRARKERRVRCKRKKQDKNSVKERISIHQRPEAIDDKLRYGDWESDTVEFKKQRACLSVQYERKSMLVRLNKIIDKSAEETKNAIWKTIESLPGYFTKSITFDNGGENAEHLNFRKELGIATYFCDPYASWQKGGVENINGLIRQYLPARTDLSKLTDRDIYEIQERLNNRPRKSLGYLTPNEIISEEFNI